MGCGSSKITVVRPVERGGSEDDFGTGKCSAFARGDSAVSNQTNDSGLGLEASEGAAPPPAILRGKFSPLTVPSSAQERQSSNDILQQLLSQGILSAPPKVGVAGQAYSLMIDSTDKGLRKPPARLQALKTSKEQPITNKEDIEEKMKRVEERRKVKEAELKQRLRSARFRGASKPREEEMQEVEEADSTPPDPGRPNDLSTLELQGPELETDSTFLQTVPPAEEEDF
ncbi:hypothetical protein AGOR_G00045610 [Albula goreensis]|uniref:Stathmin n=1 Tax=Albula goreensis TaxID=1534307 RepID=A0A8T3DZP6_9TELE|nr:hypothetical protein AGOR_G00045610 [Albula goreensis]